MRKDNVTFFIVCLALLAVFTVAGVYKVKQAAKSQVVLLD